MIRAACRPLVSFAVSLGLGPRVDSLIGGRALVPMPWRGPPPSIGMKLWRARVQQGVAFSRSDERGYVQRAMAQADDRDRYGHTHGSVS